MCIKSEFKEICLKLLTNGRSDRGFLMTSKVCPQGTSCPCPGAVYMYKIIKICINWYFEEIILKLATYRQREKAFLLPSKFCLQWIVCRCSGLYMVKHKKMCVKSDSKAFFFKLTTNGQSDKGFLLTSTFVHKGLSAPALGLYTCIKALKYIQGPGVRWTFIGRLVLWFLIYLLLSTFGSLNCPWTSNPIPWYLSKLVVATVACITSP